MLSSVSRLRGQTWSQGIPLPFVHSEALRDAVELRKTPELPPHRVIILEGSHGGVQVSQESLEPS